VSHISVFSTCTLKPKKPKNLKNVSKKPSFFPALVDRTNPPFSCDHGAATHSCIMHDPGRGTLCKNAVRISSKRCSRNYPPVGRLAAIFWLLYPRDMRKGTNAHPRINRNTGCPTTLEYISSLEDKLDVIMHPPFFGQKKTLPPPPVSQSVSGTLA